ncbi:MAG TPA: Gfo/Idh/MocA family oxidoreductase [Blastocatellia bacterium]|nr:Gfo/Idh/MocA family oxidoreductase [Blastocatellia bacterium]
MLKVAVVGVGHFGREHARVYSTPVGARLVAICDLDEARGRAVAEEFRVPVITNYRDLFGEVDAVSLAVPTADHCRIACELLDNGISVLVEKPVARTLEETDLMLAAAGRSGAILQVGHLERFNPAVIAARRIVTRPRFFEAHRLSVFTPRSLDIDVVMDLMIHDIDVVLSLTCAEVSEIRAAGIPILTPKVDIANARIEFDDGCVANLTASRVSGERVRKLRFFQPHQYVSLDYTSQEASAVSVERDSETAAWPRLSGGLIPVEKAEPLRLEIESFLRAVEGGPVEVDGSQGRRALELALGVMERIHEHAKKAGVPIVD